VPESFFKTDKVMESTRTFIAVELSEPALSDTVRLLKRLETKLPDIRWSKEEQFHITLKFLGQVDNRRLPEVCSAARDVAMHVSPFELKLEQLGTFPQGKPPRVLWAGISSGSDQLELLHEQLDTRLSEIGFPIEPRRFHPHLTLGRVNRQANKGLIEDALRAANQSFGTLCEVEELVLMASRRDRRQIVYEVMDRIQL
jgi:2'-5' RNA ligase